MSWKAADSYDLDGQGLEPGEQPMQSCLILERAVYHHAPLKVGIYGQVTRLRFTVSCGPTRGG